MSETIDLDRYLTRIGRSGPHQPTLEVLQAITAAHAQSIPFENIDVRLGRPILLELDALFDKLVTQGRGGYCYEQNSLLLAVLRQLGFEVQPLGGRVRLAQPDRRIPTQRTHMLLRVMLEGKHWITDVGMGTASLTRALRLQADWEQSTPHDTRRLQHENGRWYHQILRAGKWIDACEFTADELPFIDRKVGNWYTSTHPDSMFCQRLTMALARPDGSRVTLLDQALTERQRDGGEQTRILDKADALDAALRQHYRIELPWDDVQLLFERIS